MIAEYPLATAADVRLAIEAAEAAWPSWKKTPGPERGRVLWRAADIARRRIEEIARTLPSESRDTFTYTVRQPMGVVGLIAPWNFPWAIPVWKSALATTSIFTENITSEMKFVDEVETGMVHVNEPTVGGDAQLPLGGTKSTGVGDCEMAEEGLNFFTELKTVFINCSGKAERSMTR